MEIKRKDTLSLKRLSLNDAGDIFRLVDENREVLARHLYWVDDVRSERGARAYISTRIFNSLPGAYWFKVLLNNKSAGVFAIKYIDTDKKLAELGYWLGANASGQGITNRLIKGITPWLRDKQGVELLEIRCLEDNLASAAVAKKAGATLVDIDPAYVAGNQAPKPLHIYRKAL